MGNATGTHSVTAHGDKDQQQELLDAYIDGLNSSGLFASGSITSFGPDDPDPIAGLIYTPDGYGNVTITIPSFTAATGCTYNLNHSEDGFSTFSTDQSIAPNAAPLFVYQTGRQYRVDITVPGGYIVIGEPTIPLP